MVGVGKYMAGWGSLRRLSVCHEGFIIGIMGGTIGRQVDTSHREKRNYVGI